MRVKCAEQGSTALHVVGCALTAIQGAPVGEIRDESSYRAVVAKLQQPDRPLHLTFEAPVAPLEEQPHVSVRDHRRWDDDGRQTSRHRHFLYAPSTDATPASARDLLRLYVDEQSTKKRKTKLSEQERAAIRDERDQVRRRRAERRLRKAAARGLHEIIAAALDAGAAAPPTPLPSLVQAGADGAAAAAAALAATPDDAALAGPATLPATSLADGDEDSPMNLDAPAAASEVPSPSSPPVAPLDDDEALAMDLGAPAAAPEVPSPLLPPVAPEAAVPGVLARASVLAAAAAGPSFLAEGATPRRRRAFATCMAPSAPRALGAFELDDDAEGDDGFGTPSVPDACGCCSSGKCTSDDPSPPQQPGLDDEAAAPAPAPARPPVVRDAAAPAPARPAVPSRDAFQDLELWPGATLTSTAASFSEQGFTSLDYVRIARALQGFFPGLGAHQLIYHSSVDELLAAYYPDADAEAAEPLREEPSTASSNTLDDKTDAAVVPSEYKSGDELTFNDGNGGTIEAVFIGKTSKDVARVRVIKDEKGLVDASDPDVRLRYGLTRNGEEPNSRFWNVSWNRKSKKWQAYYYDADGKLHHVGFFFDEETAARARDEAVRAARLEGKRDMNVDESGSLVPKPVCGTRLRGRAAAVAPPLTRARPRRKVAKYADETIDEADGDEADGEGHECVAPKIGAVIDVRWASSEDPKVDGPWWRCKVICDGDGYLFVESDQEGFGDPMQFDPKDDSWRHPEEVLDEEDDLADDEEADNEPHEADDRIIVSILLTEIDGHVSRRDARAARSGETREVYDARIAKEAAARAAARKEGPPPPFPIDNLPPMADLGSSRIRDEDDSDDDSESAAEVKVRGVVARFYSVIYKETKKEERSCYFTGDGTYGKVVVVIDREATAKLLGYESWKAVSNFFSQFEFKCVLGGGKHCSWSVYQHKHFCADGAGLELVQRNDEGSRCSTTGKLRWLCPCGKQNKGFVACGGGICPKSGKPRAYCYLGCEPREEEEGKPPCGGGIARRQLKRLLNEGLQGGHTSAQIHKIFGFDSLDLRNVLIAGSPYGPSTVQMWHDRLLEVDHIISLRYLRELLGVFVTKDGDKKEPTLAALMASCLINLQLLLRYLNGLKSDEVTDKTHLGIERRYKVLMLAVEQTDPSGDGRWICPHPTKKMDKFYVNIDILCQLLKEDVAENGGEIGCEDLPRY